MITIGILGAFALNNWNESRKAEDLEMQVLGQLQRDLQQNKVEISGIREGVRQEIVAGVKVLDFLDSDRSDVDTLKFWVEQLNRAGIFNNANTTYKNLENVGGNLLSDDSLRFRITVLHEQDFQNILTRESIYYDDYRPRMMDQFWLHFERGERVNTPDAVPLEVSLNTPVNLDKLRQNKIFKNMIFDVTNFRRTRIGLLDRTLADLDQLIRDIDQQLQEIE